MVVNTGICNNTKNAYSVRAITLSYCSVINIRNDYVQCTAVI